MSTVERAPLMEYDDRGIRPTAPPSEEPPAYEAPKGDRSKPPDYFDVVSGYPGGPQQQYPGSGYQYHQHHPHIHGYSYQTQQGCCGQSQGYQQYRACCEQPSQGQTYGQTMPATMGPVHRASPDYLGLSIFTLICCWPIGICALVQSLRTRELTSTGNVDAAAASSRSTRLLNVIGIVMGCIFFGILIINVTVNSALAS